LWDICIQRKEKKYFFHLIQLVCLLQIFLTKFFCTTNFWFSNFLCLKIHLRIEDKKIQIIYTSFSLIKKVLNWKRSKAEWKSTPLIMQKWNQKTIIPTMRLFWQGKFTLPHNFLWKIQNYKDYIQIWILNKNIIFEKKTNNLKYSIIFYFFWIAPWVILWTQGSIIFVPEYQLKQIVYYEKANFISYLQEKFHYIMPKIEITWAYLKSQESPLQTLGLEGLSA